MNVLELIRDPWPWYVAGPLIGLVTGALLLVGEKQFGVSANLQHLCAIIPARVAYFRYDWKRSGAWNLVFALGIAGGAALGVGVFGAPDPVVQISEATRADLAELGLTVQPGLAPGELFSWGRMASVPSLIILLGGGFLVGFGARYAGGCTSGHSISGLANLQLPSLVATLGFFVGGLVATHWLLPIIMGGGAP